MYKFKIPVVYCFLILGFPNLYCQVEKPNILLILADDMGIDVTNGYIESATMPTTPTLDSLRANGITYKNTWSSPTCTPTRAAIMSGKYGINTGVFRAPGNLDVSDTSIFNKLASYENDTYSKALIGKWHISNPVNYNHPKELGVDYYQGLFTAQVDDYYNWEKVTNGVVSIETEYATTNITNSAINWVANQDQPWLLWLSHIAPHSPFHTPPEGLFTIDNTSNRKNQYFAAIEAMDHEIGRFIYNLDEETRNNTIVIFLGDNGTPAPGAQYFSQDHSKASIYEGGIRVPMIISGKGVSRKNEVEEGLTQVADIYATILEIAGFQLDGGIHNSLSLKPSFNCANELKRKYVYTDYEEGGVQSWAIRNNQYKLIEDENGNQEFYDIIADLLEQNNLINTLGLAAIITELSNEASIIRSGWSCNDGIKNGVEAGIDSCDADCSADDTLTSENIGCPITPEEPSVFYEYVDNGRRFLYSNNFPNHKYNYSNINRIPEQKYYNFGVDLNPTLSGKITSISQENGRPARYFGVSINGVVMVPNPAAPFIFVNQNNGEYNWDWVYEPTNNSGDGMGLVALDCSQAHTGPQGYHYHGNMYEYMETIIPGITTTLEAPIEPIHIGWASDGFPILYRFGPDSDGNIRELLPSFELKSGERPGNGITAPCGAYNGKYINDYEYRCGKGDLDACNGVNNSVTLTTQSGTQTFNYFYVITQTFPQISRCMSGNVSPDFENTATTPTGVDKDNDGFLAQFDCDDNNPEANPLTRDANCNPLLSNTTFSLEDKDVFLTPNPSNEMLTVSYKRGNILDIHVFDILGALINKREKIGKNEIEIKGLNPGMYLVKITLDNRRTVIKKIIVKK